MDVKVNKDKELKQRIIKCCGYFDHELSKKVCGEIFKLDELSPDPVWIMINSSGGDVSSMFAIYDAIQSVQCDVGTFCLGEAMSAAAFILCSGNHGMRYVSKHSSIMLHRIRTGDYDDIQNVEIRHEEHRKIDRLYLSELAKLTGQSIDTIKKEIERDRFFSPQQAKKFGIIDKIGIPKMY